jgi:hypothetical protein
VFALGSLARSQTADDLSSTSFVGRRPRLGLEAASPRLALVCAKSTTMPSLFSRNDQSRAQVSYDDGATAPSKPASSVGEWVTSALSFGRRGAPTKTQGVSKVDQSLAEASYRDGSAPPSRRQTLAPELPIKASKLRRPSRHATAPGAAAVAPAIISVPQMAAVQPSPMYAYNNVIPILPAYETQTQPAAPAKRPTVQPPKPKPVFPEAYDPEAAEQYLADRDKDEGAGEPPPQRHRRLGGRFEPQKRGSCLPKFFWAVLALCVIGGIVFAGIFFGALCS